MSKEVENSLLSWGGTGVQGRLRNMGNKKDEGTVVGLEWSRYPGVGWEKAAHFFLSSFFLKINIKFTPSLSYPF